MNEEEKAIKFLENKTTNYSLSGEALHYYSILYYLIINLQKKNKQLKEQNEFLMKQDNILQTLMQWLYKEQERYRKTLSEKPTNDKEYINIQVTSVGLEQIKIVIDKIKELKEELK